MGSLHLDHILLIERDPFVRTDMAQALQSGFPGHKIVSFATLEEADQSGAPRLLLIDIAGCQLLETLASRGWANGEVVCVLTGASGQDVSAPSVRLPRPFTDDMLLSTVREALQRIIVG